MKKLLLAWAVLVLCGCQALGVPSPQTFNQKLAVGYGTCTALVTTTDTLLKSGKLSSADAVNVEAQINNLKAALDIAAQVETTDATTGGNKLDSALTALNALSQYLTTKQGG